MDAAVGEEAQSAPPAVVDTAAQPPLLHALVPPGVTFSVYSYGFRFLKEELDVLTGIFAQNGGATPSHAELHRIAAAMSATPARLAEPPHPVKEKQIKVRRLACASALNITLTPKGASYARLGSRTDARSCAGSETATKAAQRRPSGPAATKSSWAMTMMRTTASIATTRTQA